MVWFGSVCLFNSVEGQRAVSARLLSREGRCNLWTDRERHPKGDSMHRPYSFFGISICSGKLHWEEGCLTSIIHYHWENHDECGYFRLIHASWKDPMICVQYMILITWLSIYSLVCSHSFIQHNYQYLKRKVRFLDFVHFKKYIYNIINIIYIALC